MPAQFLVNRVEESGVRRLFWRGGLVLLCLAFKLIGCAERFDHNPATAAAKAEEFARITFVDRDAETSYGLLAPGTRRYVSLEKHKEVVARLHPRHYPKMVKAGDSEPMPGEKAMYVFLTGENAGEQFYYRLTMEGTAGTGYRVLQFDRSNRPRN